MVRRAADGRLSLIDLIAVWTNTSSHNACSLLQRLTENGIVTQYEAVPLYKGRPTPIVTPDEWEALRAHIPCKTHMLQRPRTRANEDLYVMQYSCAPAIKIGRSRNVEQRRRNLEQSHNFFVTLVACFAGQGHVEPIVHKRLEMFRSTAGAGKEWYNITADQAVTAIRWVLENHPESQLHAAEQALPS